MPKHVPWDAAFSVGNELIDQQHQQLLAHCNALADCIPTMPNAPSALVELGERQFDQIFNALLADARTHFADEAKLLAQMDKPALDALEAQQDAQDEFEYLVADIVTAENFSKTEIQRFLALWCVGHLLDSGKRLRT